MSKIVFNYGVMNSAKTMELLASQYRYESIGYQTILIKPAQDDRSGRDVVASRIGLTAKADLVVSDDTPKGFEQKLISIIKEEPNKKKVILIDESQFISPDIVESISWVSRTYDVNVFSYGLMKTFQNNLFDGSAAWVSEATSLHEIKSTCEVCGHKATHNLRLLNGKPVYSGSVVMIGDQEYKSVCAEHYHNFPVGA